MSNYTGTECLVCKEKFNDNDDIVVCPQCGTPYHRDCYFNEGKCINAKLHEENKSWSQERNESKRSMPKKCPSCNTENKPHSLICESCGTPLIDNLNFNNESRQKQSAEHGTTNYATGEYGFTFNPNDKYYGMNPEEVLDSDVKISEAADFIGTNVPYYLMLFKRMKATGKKISVNFICLLFPQYYFASRKMWLEAVFTTILGAVFSLPKVLAFVSTMTSASGNEKTILNFLSSYNIDKNILEFIFTAANYAGTVLGVLACLFANWLYYRHMQKKIVQIKNRFGSPEDISQNIASSGGTSIFGIILILALQLIISAILVYGLIYI